MGVIYTTTLLGKRQGFAARKDFIPTVQQQGCVLRAPEAQEAQSTPDLVWGSQMPEPVLQSPGQHWHLTALPRVQPGVSWRALYQQQTQWNTSSLIFKCWAEWGEWWATYSSLLVSHQGLTEMPQKKWSSCPTCLFFNLNLPVTLARLV